MTSSAHPATWPHLVQQVWNLTRTFYFVTDQCGTAQHCSDLVHTGIVSTAGTRELELRSPLYLIYSVCYKMAGFNMTQGHGHIEKQSVCSKLKLCNTLKWNSIIDISLCTFVSMPKACVFKIFYAKWIWTGCAFRWIRHWQKFEESRTCFVKNSLLLRWSTPSCRNLVCSRQRNLCLQCLLLYVAVDIWWYVVTPHLPVAELSQCLLYWNFQISICVYTIINFVTRETWTLICVSLRLQCVYTTLGLYCR